MVGGQVKIFKLMTLLSLPSDNAMKFANAAYWMHALGLKFYDADWKKLVENHSVTKMATSMNTGWTVDCILQTILSVFSQNLSIRTTPTIL